jgi:four helix bundle protein
MEKKRTAKQKSMQFSIHIVYVYRKLYHEKNEYVLSKQLLRSGTSIGANLAEAECAMSARDFLAKVYISLKETAETLYWLELLHDTEYLDENEYKNLYQECSELKKMLSATTKTLQKRLMETKD